MAVSEVVHASKHVEQRRAARADVYLEEARLDAGVLWLAVPDAAIPSVAKAIVRQRGCRLRGQIVVHSSGALSSETLQAAANAGAATASVHPMMSFPTRKPVALANVPFGVEAADASARRTLFALVRKLGGSPFKLGAEGKALYHVAGTLASPLLTSLLTVAIGALQEAGLPRAVVMRLLSPIAQRTVENVFRAGPEQSFSGPIARGDAETVALHLRALHVYPLWQEAYRSLASSALASLPAENAAEIRKRLRLK